jgi:hypothetical protein
MIVGAIGMIPQVAMSSQGICASGIEDEIGKIVPFTRLKPPWEALVKG